MNSSHAGPNRYFLRAPSLLLAAGVLGLATLTACASQSDNDVAGAFDVLVNEAHAEAQASGAAQSQLSLLTEAQDLGEMPVESARAAVNATVECFEIAGLNGEVIESTGRDGVVIPGYSVSVEGSWGPEHDAAASDCERQHSAWVDKVYQLQPSVQAAREQYVESIADDLRACLEDAGYETETDASGVELSQRAGDVASETRGEVDCLRTTGAL